MGARVSEAQLAGEYNLKFLFLIFKNFFIEILIDFIINFLISKGKNSTTYDIILVIINKYTKYIYYIIIYKILKVDKLIKLIIK